MASSRTRLETGSGSEEKGLALPPPLPLKSADEPKIWTSRCNRYAERSFPLWKVWFTASWRRETHDQLKKRRGALILNFYLTPIVPCRAPISFFLSPSLPLYLSPPVLYPFCVEKWISPAVLPTASLGIGIVYAHGARNTGNWNSVGH